MPPLDQEAENARLKSKWGTCRADELEQRCAAKAFAKFVINRYIPEQSLGVMVGDSGLGKSPLAYQMAVCAATGIPFLGEETRQVPVLYLDYENGSGQVNQIISQLVKFLGLVAPPRNLILWNINESTQKWGQLNNTAYDLIREVRPGLVFIDPISGLYPEIEAGSKEATTTYQIFRKLMRDCGCSIVALHHKKKPQTPKPGNTGMVPSLEEALNARAWFNDARGSGVLVNGADVRLGIDAASISRMAKADVSLVLRGYGRVTGEIPTTHLLREMDADGEPFGYRKATGIDLLSNQDQQNAYQQLPEQFSFKEAKHAYNREDQATSDFLKKCSASGILLKVSKGVYAKVK